MLKFLFLDDATTPTGLGQSWPLILLIVGFLALMLVMQIIPQRKNQKKMIDMLNNLAIGDEIKTIGGMVGKVYAIDNDAGLLVINVGTDEVPTYITIDKVAIYTVAPKETAAPVENEQPTEEQSNENTDNQ